MKLKLTYFALTAVALGLQAAPASAHQFYHGEIALKGAGGKLSGSLGTAYQWGSSGAWVFGSRWGLPAMASDIAGEARLYRFHLDQDALVNLTVTPAAQPGGTLTPKDRNTWQPSVIDPAVSLYQGLLPAEAMDNDVGSLNSADPTTFESNYINNEFAAIYWGGYSVTAVSPWDAAPFDPAIPKLLGQVDANGVMVNDTNFGWGAALLTLNPDWDDPSRTLAVLAADPKYATNEHLWWLVNFKDEGNLTPKQWYDKHYKPHNGYRDTLNYTDIGGTVTPEQAIELGYFVLPGSWPNYSLTNGNSWSWHGQIDPIGDFSLANGYAASHPESAATETHYPDIALNPAGVDWAKIYHVGHANAHDGETYTGSDGSTQLPAPNLTAERLHNQVLAKGDYTVLVAGGCGSCIDSWPGASANHPVVSDYAASGISISLQAWPVQACNLSTPAKAKPEIAPVSGPWDVEAGQTLKVPLVAHYCGGNPPTFSATGLSGATVATTSVVNTRTGYLNDGSVVDDTGNSIPTPNHLGWQSQLSWTADNVTEVTTRKVSITAADGSKQSKAQKTSVRIWPKGMNPGNSFDFQAPIIKWDANNANLSITAKVTLKNTKVLLPEEKAAIFGRPLRLLGTESTDVVSTDGPPFLGFFTVAGPFADSKGQIKYSTKLDATTVPCKVQWVFGHFTGLATVANAPGNCVQ